MHSLEETFGQIDRFRGETIFISKWNYMAGHPRIEATDLTNLCTTRSRNSELWFVNNSELEYEILGLIAKLQARYKVTLYGVAIEGNHIHLEAQFPEGNRASFMRDLNSGVARAVPRHVLRFPGGHFWARRYSSEFLGDPSDVENYFFYIALQPVNDGLVEHPCQYPGYNCFRDAVTGRRRKFTVFRRWEYNDCKRANPGVKREDFEDEFELVYSRLPGYENMPQKDYEEMMNRKFELRRRQKVQEFRQKSRKFMGRHKLLQVRPGGRPNNTKQGTRFSFRPRILCEDKKRREELLTWYFDIYFGYKAVSREYRKGDLCVEFPHGTYRPPNFTTVCDSQSQS